MACNAVATVRTRVAADLSGLINPTPEVAALIRQILAPALACDPAIIWPIDYRQYAPGQHPSAGAYEYYANGISIDVFPTEIQVGAGSAAQAEAIKARIAPALQALAGILLQAKIRATVAARARITGETRTANGALVLNVEM